jgi:hypothetical protein
MEKLSLTEATSAAFAAAFSFLRCHLGLTEFVTGALNPLKSSSCSTI